MRIQYSGALTFVVGATYLCHKSRDNRGYSLTQGVYMKKIGALVLGLASFGLCLDEYLPVAKGALEVDLAYGYTGFTGGYDSSGDKKDYPSGFSKSSNAIPLQIKYGILEGLDVELMWAFQMYSMETPAIPPLIPATTSDASGFGQPELCLKYALMDIGAGVHVNFTAPFATGDFADPDAPPMALTFGALYTKLFVPQFNLTAIANYKLNFEAEDSSKAGNVISIYAKPEFRFNQFGGAYLGVQYDINSESEYNGTGNKDEGSLLTLKPGWNATWLPTVSTELLVPITVMGKRADAGWGILANVYLTLPM